MNLVFKFIKAALLCTLPHVLACGGAPPLVLVREDPTDAPIAGLTPDERDAFDRGDALIEAAFRESQGLGPLYIRASCVSCHADDAKGPGAVERMIVVEDDGVTPAADQGALPYGTVVRPQLAAGATRGIVPPDLPRLKRSLRVGPALFGRGYLEAVSDEAILAEAARQAAAGRVRGVPNRLPSGALGRLGVKARLATLDAFTADAFLGDMGLTSPDHPDELPNPDGLTDDRHAGVDVSAETVRDIATYIRLLAIPRREGLTDAGAHVFAAAGCADCHAPTMRTRADFPVPLLAGIDAPIYSDLLLHDLGDALADGIRDGEAGPRAWRTAPLIGLRHLRGYLHDGRAATLDEAIRAHGGAGSEARFAVDRYDALSPDERERLLEFVGHL